MHDHGQFPRDRDLGFLHAFGLGQAKAPRLDRGPLSGAREKRCGGLEQISTEQGITTLRDPANAVHFAGLVALRRQAKIGANQFRLGNRFGSSMTQT